MEILACIGAAFIFVVCLLLIGVMFGVVKIGVEKVDK